jgi:Protein of unknown function (DUF2796)
MATMKTWTRTTLLFACLAAAPLLAQAQAHEHGAARLDVALDGSTLTLQLQTPLDALFGFERAPRNDAERKLVDAAIARLRAADRLFKPDPAAGCTLKRVELNSATLKLGAAPGGAPATPANTGHADLDATLEFECKDAAKVGILEVGLFDAYPRMQRIDVQVATPKGQFKRSLKRPANKVPLAGAGR